MDIENEEKNPQEQDLNHLSRRERKKIKKQQKEEQLQKERVQRKRKKIINKIIILSGIILVIVLYLFFRSYGLKDAPKMQVDPASYNFGSVSVAKGAVSTFMTLENQGVTDLIIDKIKSTCGCTSASLVVDGIESPTFGMHDSSTGWSATLKPWQKAQLKVNDDPRVHRDLRGAVTREVVIYSNDPKNKAKKVRIDAYHVD